jgi:hypothetical protein
MYALQHSSAHRPIWTVHMIYNGLLCISRSFEELVIIMLHCMSVAPPYPWQNHIFTTFRTLYFLISVTKLSVVFLTNFADLFPLTRELIPPHRRTTSTTSEITSQEQFHRLLIVLVYSISIIYELLSMVYILAKEA